MLRRETKLWMLTMSLCAGAVVQCGCGGADGTIRLVPSPIQPGKLMLNPQKGQTIQWDTVRPTFSPNPCDSDPSVDGKCKVKEASGAYMYSCPGPNNPCTDPEVVVGPDVNPFKGTIVAAGARVTPDPVSMYCDNNQVTLNPLNLPVAAAAGETVNASWVATGNASQKIADPQVTFTAANPAGPPLPACTSKQSGGITYVTCPFTAPMASTVYSYTAASQSGACKTPNTGGTITLTVH